MAPLYIVHDADILHSGSKQPVLPIRGMVGSKDILSLPLPAETYLPLSELQKQAEEAEYSELLDKVRLHVLPIKHLSIGMAQHALHHFAPQAAACPKGSVERMEQVVAFSVSSYSSCQRPMRSLNPLLSETFEFVYPEKGIRIISEHASAASLNAVRYHTLP